MGFETQDVERKALAILRILNESQEPLGARIIGRRLKDHGIELGERAVRYHLKLMDGQGLTRLVGRDGRLVTPLGIEELKSALVGDKVGFALSKIELLAFRTNFDLQTRTGSIPVNVSFFPKDQFRRAIEAMQPAFAQGICAGHLVAIAQEGEKLGKLTIPPEKWALPQCAGLSTNLFPR